MSNLILPVTFTFLGMLAITLFALTAWVGLQRGRAKALRGDRGDAALFKRIRIHGNLIETAPTFVLVLAASEASGLTVTWLWAAAATFVVGRILHYQLFDNPKRGLSMLVTLAPGVLLSGRLLYLVWA